MNFDLETKREDIIRVMKEAENAAYHYPTCEYRVYIDTDGDVGYEEWLAGDRCWYQFHNDYDRLYIHTFCHQYFDILFDYWFNGIGEFESAFEERFGFRPDNDPDRTYYDDGAETCKAHGISHYDYGDWIEKQTNEAIEILQTETDYDEILDICIEEYERGNQNEN